MSFDRNAYQREYMRQRRQAQRAQLPAPNADPNALTPRQLAQQTRRLRERQEAPQLQDARLRNVRAAQQARRAREAQAAQRAQIEALASLADRVLAHVLASGGQVVGPAGVCALLDALALSVEQWTQALTYLRDAGRVRVQEPADPMADRKFIFTA